MPAGVQAMVCNDIAALRNWLSAGARNLFLTGDQVVSDLVLNSGAAGRAFAEDVVGVDLLIGNPLRWIIDDQKSPLVKVVPSNSVVHTASQWHTYGGCPGINDFDVVTVRSGAERLAEFTDTGGATGAYTCSAATLNTDGLNNRVISLPYDFMYVRTVAGNKAPAPLPVRTVLLDDVLTFFGESASGDPSSVPELLDFSVAVYPNPFNPGTRLDYRIKASGHLSLRVYNVRGQLVRTLIDGPVETSGHVMWDGTDEGGAQVASGVYFSETRMGKELQINKMALIK